MSRSKDELIRQSIMNERKTEVVDITTMKKYSKIQECGPGARSMYIPKAIADRMGLERGSTVLLEWDKYRPHSLLVRVTPIPHNTVIPS